MNCANLGKSLFDIFEGSEMVLEHEASFDFIGVECDEFL
jgi:hypothetical protein